MAVAYPRVSTNPPVFPTIIYKNEKMPAKYSIPARKGTIKVLRRPARALDHA